MPDVLAQLSPNRSVVLQTLRLPDQPDADYAAHVVVSNVNGGVVETLETTDLQVLADGPEPSPAGVLNGAFAPLCKPPEPQRQPGVLDNNDCPTSATNCWKSAFLATGSVSSLPR